MTKRIIIVTMTVVIMAVISICISSLRAKENSSTPKTIENGILSYTMSVKYGYEGTLQDWLETLNKKSPYKIVIENGYSGSESEWNEELDGCKDNQINIESVIVDEKSQLIVVLSDGSILNVGNIVKRNENENSKDNIVRININKKGQLILEYKDGNKVNLDNFVGIDRANEGYSKGDTQYQEISEITIKDDGNIKLKYVDKKTEVLNKEQLDTPIIMGNNISANPGSEVTVVFSLKNNPGILGMTLELEFDENIMTLTKIKGKTALNEMTFTEPKILKSGCKFLWDAEQVFPEDVTNGDILALIFNVSDTAESGVYDISMSYDEGAIIDNDMNPINMLVKNGTIIVE